MTEYDVQPDEIFSWERDEQAVQQALPHVRCANLSDEFVEALAAEKSEYRVRDREQPGLCVRVRPSGAKSYYYWARPLEIGEKPIKKALGRVGEVSCEQARRLADEHSRRRHLGITLPSDERLRPATLQEAYDQYGAHFVNTPHWTRGHSLMARFVLPRLGDARIAAISRFEFVECIAEAASGGRTCANVLQKRLKTFLYWCVVKDFIHANPLARLPMPAPPRRTGTLLFSGKLAQLYAASREMSWPWRGMIGTLILTGLNVQAMRHLRNEHIDWTRGLFCPRGCDPSRADHWEPISEQALIALSPGRAGSGFVFSSPCGAEGPYELRRSVLLELQSRAGTSSWSWVDLVRSVRRAMRDLEKQDASPWPEECWRERQRAHLEAWALELLRLYDQHLAEAQAANEWIEL